MVRVEDKQNIKCAFKRGVRVELRLGGAEQHVQKIAGIAQIIVGIYKRHSENVSVGKSGEGGHLADQTVSLFATRVWIEDVLRVRIKGGERSDGRNQHAHRVRVIMETFQEFLDALVDERMVRDVVVPVFQLRLCRKLTMQNQIGRFGVGALLRKFFDRRS